MSPPTASHVDDHSDGQLTRAQTGSLESDPYWVPPGVELDDWPPALRSDVASVINPTYRELVSLARPGLEQSTGITIVHLLWLEILDQVQLGRQLPAPGVQPHSDPFQVLGLESRTSQIERHLRLVHAKLKASELLRRIEGIKDRWHSQDEPDTDYPNLSAFPRQRLSHGKSDFC